MISKLSLLSRYMFVTTEEQARDLLELSKEPERIEGLLIILDSNLVVSSRHAYKLTVGLTYLVSINRKLNLGFLIVGNKETKLDKRLDRQLTHSSKIVSKEWPQEVTL